MRLAARRTDATAVVEARLRELLDRGTYDAAATAVIRDYGPELLGYLTAIMRNDDWARDVFAQFCENMWRGLPAFRRECSVRTVLRARVEWATPDRDYIGDGSGGSRPARWGSSRSRSRR
jgi:hypothetical protein